MKTKINTAANRPIRSRWDLPFVQRTAQGRINYWSVDHKPTECWHTGVSLGESYADALLDLAEFDPVEAFIVMLGVQSSMIPNGWGEETGFMSQLLRYAFAGRQVFGDAIPPAKDVKLSYERMLELDNNESGAE